MKKTLPSGVEYEVPWDGRPMFPYPFLAFDTETTIVDLSREVPALATLQVSNGRRHVIVSPDQVTEFVRSHLECHWVAWNAAFDWHVVHAHLPPQWRDGWRAVLREGRVRDAMLLDFLARLADPGAAVWGFRNLGQAAQEIGFAADKDSDYRMRFGEVIGVDWDTVDPGFWEYAIGDVIATHHLYARLYRNIPSEPTVHGPLTESLQTRAAVVLADVGRLGFGVDAEKVSTARHHLKEKIDSLATELEREIPGVWRRYKVHTKNARARDLMVNKTTGVPRMDLGVLRAHLQTVAEGMDVSLDTLPRTEKTGELSTALDPWREIAGDHPTIAAWGSLVDLCKLHQFLVQLDTRGTAGAVHANYNVLVRTGRTSCRQPNVQQMPREPWLRELFVARPGYRLAIVDYSAIELVTLAAVCLGRYGQSVLADQLRAGRDPHAYTAALMLGVDYQGFLVLKGGSEEEAARFKRERQAAKAINFGVPGGLGAAKLAAYARANYQVILLPEDARRLKDQLVTRVYPELTQYLSDNVLTRLAANLGKSPDEIREVFKRHLRSASWDGFLYLVDRVVGGETKANGHLLSSNTRQAVWDGLAELTSGDANLFTWVTQRKAGSAMWRRLLGDRATTLTGRERAGLSYTEARNTPFQGLAADGAKVALWRLWDAGYRIVAFVHDEIVCEVRAATAESELREMEKIMIEAMTSVLGCDIPVKVEGKVSDRWTK